MKQREVFLLLPLLLWVLSLVGESFFGVDAIKCYVCQSNVDPKCADPFDNLTLPITDCDAYPRADLAQRADSDVTEERSSFFPFLSQSASIKPLRATMCRKIRQKVNGEWRTIRGCGYLGSPGDLPPESSDLGDSRCQMRYGKYDVFMETCACNNKDGCNGSISSVGVSLWAQVFISMVALIMVAIQVDGSFR